MPNKADPNAKQSAEMPKLSGVFESSIYSTDLDAAQRFYGQVLGLTQILSVPGRQIVFRCQDSILLIFNPEHTQTQRVIINGGPIPFHGTQGAGHVAFRVGAEELDCWRMRLRQANVAIESEVSWPNGAHSIYFRDPAGNSLEFATPDMWAS
jgi:catechol 2,3-dioxygenase-like lactoylglutathione lyase family enzyme